MKGEVRIIAGKWRGRTLFFDALEGLRPTPNRGRETLFNWLGQSLPGWHCLDLYAGSGALGFEACSRGASSVTFIDKNPLVLRALAANAKILGDEGVMIFAGEARRWLSKTPKRFDLIFLDPPFASQEMVQIWPLLASHINPGGWVYAESAQGVRPTEPWHEVRCTKMGQARLQLFQLNGASDS